MITYGEGKARLMGINTINRVFDDGTPMTMVKGLLFLEKKGMDMIFPCFLMGTEEDTMTLTQIGINDQRGMELYKTEMPMATFKKEWRLWSLPPKEELRQKTIWFEKRKEETPSAE